MNVYSVTWCGESRLWSAETMAGAIEKDYLRWRSDWQHDDTPEQRADYENDLASVCLIGELEG